MTISKALTPFAKLRLENDITNIIRYFEQKKKQNIKLVLVILPNVDNAYSKYGIILYMYERKIFNKMFY